MIYKYKNFNTIFSKPRMVPVRPAFLAYSLYMQLCLRMKES